MGAQPTLAPVPQPAPVTPSTPATASTRKPFWPRVWRLLTKFFVLPLVGVLISGMVIGRVADAIFGPKSYHIYVVGNDSDSDPATQKLLAAAAAPGRLSSTLAGVPVETAIVDDSGDPSRAATIAQELASKPDTLMVIGHVYSTTTGHALPTYLQADPPIPVFLTTETNPGLLPPRVATDEYVPPVFRLFPTDDDQANVAATFIASNPNSRSVWVVEDTSNPTYSHYLASTFVDDVYSKTSMRVLLWSNNVNLPPYAVDKLGIDWVFFAGDWRNALVLIRQLQAMPGGRKPKVLLTDASVDPLLLQYGGADVDGIYLLHPMPADVFEKEAYGAVGKEASGLANVLLQKVDGQFTSLATDAAPVGYRLRKWLGLRRVSDARRALAHFMAVAVNNEIVFAVPDGTIGTTVKMGKDKNRAVVRKDASFHVWQVAKVAESRQFVQVK